MKKIFTLYYNNDDQVLFFPDDKEKTALQYIALRYIEKKEPPIFMEDNTGRYYDKGWGDEDLERLVTWYYSLYPKYRRESYREGVLESFSTKMHHPNLTA